MHSRYWRGSRALAEARLEAVLIGNAAAALRGAPVTTLDFDFCFRATRMAVAGETIWVADLADVAEGKRRANRGKDRAVLHGA